MYTEDSYSYTGIREMYSNSCCTVRLAQGCVTGLKGMTVNSVEALITALIPQLVSDVIEVNTFSFQICRRFQNAAKNGRDKIDEVHSSNG